MAIKEWLKFSESELRAAGIATARLDTLVLLEDALKKDRSWILAHLDMELPDSVKNVLNVQFERRALHEPLSYIRGKSEFYGREFIVSPAVLEPRPESETMIEMLLAYLTSHPELDSGSSRIRRAEGTHNGLDSSLRWNDSGDKTIRIMDVGAGSGALGITAYLELKNAIVDLAEIDNKAIKIAKMNVIKFSTGQKVIKSDLLSQARFDYDILLCNLPYVPDNFQINEAATSEPKIAIFGGSDGLDVYRRLFEQTKKLKNKPLLILTESMPPQHEKLADIAAQNGYEIDAEDDFIQAFVASYARTMAQ